MHHRRVLDFNVCVHHAAGAAHRVVVALYVPARGHVCGAADKKVVPDELVLRGRGPWAFSPGQPHEARETDIACLLHAPPSLHCRQQVAVPPLIIV